MDSWFHMRQTVGHPLGLEAFVNFMRLNRCGPLVETCCKKRKHLLNLLGRDSEQCETLCLVRLQRWASEY